MVAGARLKARLTRIRDPDTGRLPRGVKMHLNEIASPYSRRPRLGLGTIK